MKKLPIILPTLYLVLTLTIIGIDAATTQTSPRLSSQNPIFIYVNMPGNALYKTLSGYLETNTQFSHLSWNELVIFIIIVVSNFLIYYLIGLIISKVFSNKKKLTTNQEK